MDFNPLNPFNYQKGLANQLQLQGQNAYNSQPLGQLGLVPSMLLGYSNPNPFIPAPQPVKESSKMTNQTLEHLKQVAEDTTASTAARDAAKLLVAREEALLAEKRAARQAEAKKELEQLFTEGREVRESELISMAKRAGVKVLKAASAGIKEKVRLINEYRHEDIRELLAEGWTIGRTLNHGYFEMLAPALAEKPRARAKK